MPTYDYKCPGCGHRFEDFRPMTDPDADCPVCGKKAVKLFSPGAGSLFKGSVFYITDYRSSEYKKRAAAEKDAPIMKTKNKAAGKTA